MVAVGEKIRGAWAAPVEGNLWENVKRASGVRLLGRIFLWIITIIFIGGIILAVILGAIFLYQSYTGGYTGTIGKEGLKNIEETGTPAAAKLGVLDSLEFIFNPSQARQSYTWESEVIENERNEDLGVKIIRFDETASPYYDGDQIQLVGEVHASSLKEEGSVVSFKCEMEDYPDPARVVPETIDVFSNGGVYVETVSCYFDNGIRVEEGKKEASKFAVLKASYDFTTQSSLRVYFMDDALLDSYRAQKRDPFEQIDEPRLKEDRTIRSQSTEGPMDVSINIRQSQPFTETLQNGYVNVHFSHRSDWLGNFERLNYLDFRVPAVIELTDDAFCDFVFTGEYDENGFKMYALTDKAMNTKANVDCSSLTSIGMDLDACIKQYKDELTFNCNFKVDYLPEGNLFSSAFYAKTDYVFTATKKEVITAFKRDIVVDNCEGETEDSCLALKGCRTVYGASESDYLGCDVCPNEWRFCADYSSSRKLCENDPCNLGGLSSQCTFDGVKNVCEGKSPP